MAVHAGQCMRQDFTPTRILVHMGLNTGTWGGGLFFSFLRGGNLNSLCVGGTSLTHLPLAQLLLFLLQMAHNGSFEAFYKDILRQLQSTGKLEEISSDFSKLQNDRSRAAFAMKLPAVNNAMKLDCAGASKSNADALKFKDLGNKQFQACKFEEAAKLYTKSILHAPRDGSSTLSIGFANRSAALFRKGWTNLALLDIERAFAGNYPEDIRYKLYDRKGKCLKVLGNTKEAFESFNRALDCLQSCNLGGKKLAGVKKDLDYELKECQSVLEKECIDTDIKTLKISEDCGSETAHQHLPAFCEPVHDIFTSLSGSCNVSYTKERGRFIVANRDMKPGEIVVIEKPFASVLLLEHSLDYCHHCFKKVTAPIPSAHCCFAMFCNDDCTREAEPYHQYEWASLENVYKSGVGKFGFLALRTVAKCGPEYLRKFDEEVSGGLHSNECKTLQGTSKSGTYEASDFNTIFSLVTHAEDRTVKDLFRRSLMAVFLLKCLEKGSFFEKAQDLAFREFVAGLLLSHLQSFPCNAHEISELELQRRDIANSVSVEIGAGIYSTLSLFNHSCDPVANRNFYGDTCVVRTIRSVKKGDEISDNYGAVYAVHSFNERLSILQPQYYFRCACQACVENWPLYPDINSEVHVWKCESCHNPLLRAPVCAVDCPTCGSVERVDSKLAVLQNSQKCYQRAFSHLLEGKVDEALPVFLLHLQNIDNLLCRPWQEYNNCQEAVKQCFSILGNHHEV